MATEYKLSYTANEIDRKLSKIGEAVLYTEQQLNESQKAQARENIGAVTLDEVLTALATPVFGTVDNENNIILTGALADGTYTLKYEFSDGSTTTIGTLKHESTTPSYTNQIPISTDFDGNIYNGTGYSSGSRINSSGGIGTITNYDATHAVFLTGFIPVKKGDVVRMKNCFIDPVTPYSEDNVHVYGNYITTFYTPFYDSQKVELFKINWTAMDEGNEWCSCAINSDSLITEFTVTGENVTYIRLNPARDGDPADAIITVNEEIPA